MNEIKLQITVANIQDITRKPQLFLDKLNAENRQTLQHYLLDNLSDKDGGPTVDNLAISNFNFDTEARRGRFRLNFTINRRFCCSDIEACGNDYLDFTFTYNWQTIEAVAQYFDWSLTN
ncbi:hypothetical protein ACL9RF_05750 [Sphingobacterium sp. Mn56C]|uniref:hypothetical protein n=1 Tax=Sphingobacterium sp. Mn56C TaxID=3395261 RepID=UPI003BECBBB0